jgi:hypothetical protein
LHPIDGARGIGNQLGQTSWNQALFAVVVEAELTDTHSARGHYRALGPRKNKIRGRLDAVHGPLLLGPFVPFLDPRLGRPSTPMEVYLRLMFLKFR